MRKRYYASKKKALTVFLGAMIIWVLMLLTPPPPGSHRTVQSLLEGTAWFIALVVVLQIWMLASYVEIDSEKVSYLEMDLRWKPSAPIKKIIGIGLPTRNWLIPVMYIWYDDPGNPGKDKYIKIKQAVFDDKTLVQIATDLKTINPQIEVDDKLEKLIEELRG